jgi:hypothetical protein
MKDWFRNKQREWIRRYRNWRAQIYDTQFAMIRATVIVVLLLVVAGIVYVAGRPAWNAWRHRKAMAQAMDYAERQDYRNTMLALKRATELAPMDLATWREVADRLAELGAPQALVARENVVRLDPGDMSMRLALVTDALRFGQTDVASATLEDMEKAAQADAAFHRLAAAVAMATGESDRLEEHLAALVAAEPEDTTARFNLAAVRLWSINPATQAEALAELEKLTAVREMRVRAGLELLKQAARVRDADRARAVVDLLLNRMGVAPSLRVSYDQTPPGWAALVQGLEDTAELTGAADVALVARWLGDVRMGTEALSWLDRLPESLRTAPAVARVDTLLTAETDNLDRLESLLRAGGLGPIPTDATRLAVASRVQQSRYQEPHGRATWEDAITACAGSVSALSGLATLSDVWRDAEGNELVLREILQKQPRLNWARMALRNRYLARGDTVRLWQLYESWVNGGSTDSSVVRPWLTMGAVLDRLSAEAVKVALDRAGQPQADALDLSLAAAAQWRRHSMTEALAWLDKLPPADRTRPDVAFWRAVILADTDRHAEAAEAARLAKREGLSLEEKALLAPAGRFTGRPGP